MDDKGDGIWEEFLFLTGNPVGSILKSLKYYRFYGVQCKCSEL